LNYTSPYVGGAINRQRSAIQWAGNSHENSTLPASNLLRTLYANRESVIRSSSRPSYVSSDAYENACDFTGIGAAKLELALLWS
jgi:hypothetical protein